MILTPQELQLRLTQGSPLKLIDVREANEWEICHLPNAQLFPLSKFPNRILDEIDPEEPIVVYCHHGVRSAQAQSFLHSQGFKEVYNLSGGIEEWARSVDPSMPRY